MTRSRALQGAVIIVLLVPIGRLIPRLPGLGGPATPPAGPAWDARNATLARAQVFVPDPPEPISELDLTRPVGDVEPLAPHGTLECRFVPEPVSGTTPKFDCALPDGPVVKVKYGRTPERQGEVAATRLLAALGFGADHVEVVERLRCTGCPPMPFAVAQLGDLFMVPGLVERLFDPDRVREFEWVSVERDMAGRDVEVGDLEGWAFYELEGVDAARGGASQAELDALRLMAVFLAHWDNKAGNQRLLCPDHADGPAAADCQRPLLMLQDVGATFGPNKVDYEGWRNAPIWADADTCRISMATMPFDGGTFVPLEISEAGRQLLVSRLRQLTDEQLRALFAAARFPNPDPDSDAEAGDGGGGGGGRDAGAWVRLFRERVSRLAGHAPCR